MLSCDDPAADASVTTSDVLVGREPIFDHRRSVHGYELVLGTGWAGGPDEHGLQAAGEPAEGRFLLTSAVVFGSLELGIDRFVGDKLMFCDASEDVLRGATSPLVPPDRTVLEVPTGAVFGASSAATVGPVCHELVREGYSLALDDFRWFPGAEEMLPLFAYAKVDRRRFDADGVAAVVEGCRPYGTRVVVHPVDTMAALTECVELGVDLCQGYLLLTPQPVEGKVLDPGQLASLRLAARLLDPDTGVDELEAIVRTDPTLSLQVLNMAAIGAPGRLRRTVRTVREALVLVGWRRLRSWMSLLLFTGGDVLPTEALTAALTRARMCELLGPRIDPGCAEVAFTTGMLSVLDVLLGVPLTDAVAHLPLAEEVRAAVVDRTGPLGQLLADVIDYQMGSPATAVRSGFSRPVLQEACFDALAWAIEMATGLDAGTVL